jgi:hypothetical protein
LELALSDTFSTFGGVPKGILAVNEAGEQPTPRTVWVAVTIDIEENQLSSATNIMADRLYFFIILL